MKGIVFTEFLAMVEEKFGYEMVDKIIVESNLPNDGAYSSTGTYDHQELMKMIAALNDATGLEIPALVKAYGEFFFEVLRGSYGSFFENIPGLFAFLESIHGHIHVEVLKLYPEAELPAFDVTDLNDKKMVMVYTSERKLSDFALGMIQSAANYFKEEVVIEKEKLDDEGVKVKFTITKA